MPRIALSAELQTGTLINVATVEGIEGSWMGGGVCDPFLLSPPQISRTRSRGTFGIQIRPDITLELDNTGSRYTSIFTGSALAQRTAKVIIRRHNLDTGAESIRYVGYISQVQFTRNRSIILTIQDRDAAAFQTVYPRYIATSSRFPRATENEKFGLNAPIPYHFGAHREHSPCTYQQDWTHLGRHRFVAGVHPSNPTSNPLVRPYITDVYLGTQNGTYAKPRGEYTVCWCPYLTTPTGLSRSATTGTRTGTNIQYAVAAVTPFGVSGVAFFSTITLASQGALLSWTPVPLAWGYHIFADFTGVGHADLIAEVPGGDASSFTDDGSYTFITDIDGNQIATSGTVTSGLGTVELMFPSRPLSQGSEPAPVLVDVETVELGPDASTKGLWLFRDSLRDESINQNWFVPLGGVGQWLFSNRSTTTCPSKVGSSGDLTLTGFTKANYKIGRAGKAYYHFGGTSYGAIAGPASVIDQSTGSFRLVGSIRADEGSINVSYMGLAAHKPSTAGWEFAIKEGVLWGKVGSGATEVEVKGVTKLDGAWHDVELRVNRGNATLSVWIDGVQDGTASLSPIGAGSLTNTGSFYVGSRHGGAQPFQGDIESFAVINGTLTDSFTTGRTALSNNALDTSSTALSVPDATDVGLDPLTGAWRMKVWFKRTGSVGTTQWLARKEAATHGYSLFFNTSNQLVARVIRSSTSNTVGSTGSFAAITADGKWHLAVLSLTRGASGSLQLFIDGVLQGTSALSGDSSPVSIASGTDFVVGGVAAGGSEKFQGLIDEIEVGAAATTLDEVRECFYLGMQNPARQVRNLLSSSLHGASLTLDSTTWDTAEDALHAIESGGIQSAYAMVEQASLEEHLLHFLKLRGMSLGLDSSGNVTMTVDTLRSNVATLGYADGHYENCSEPIWANTPVEQLSRSLVVGYRRLRDSTGAVSRFLLGTASRTLVFSTLGVQSPVTDDVPTLRTQLAADIYASYVKARYVLGDWRVQLDASEDALDIVPGDVITLLDPTGYGASTAVEINEVREGGIGISLEGVLWNSNIYTYVPAGFPVDTIPDTAADFSTTPPLAVTSLSVTPSFLTTSDGAVLTTISASWVNPSTNFKTALLQWKKSSDALWNDGGETSGTTLAFQGSFLHSTPYDFRVLTKNAYGIYGPAAFTTVGISVPGVPGNVTAVTSEKSGHQSRRWSWTGPADPESTIDYYEWQVYDSSATSGGNPTGTLKQSGKTKSLTARFHEDGLSKVANQRWIRVRAVSKSAQTGNWTSLTADSQGASSIRGATTTSGTSSDINSGAVGQADATQYGFTDASNVIPFSGQTLTEDPTWKTVASINMTCNGGAVVGFINGYIDITSDWGVTELISIRFTRDGTAISGTTNFIVGGITNSAPNFVLLPLSASFTDTSPGGSAGSGQSRTYACQMQTFSAGGRTVKANGNFNAIEFKR